MNYLLIIYIVGVYQSPTIETQIMPTLKTCEFAKEEILNLIGRAKVTCLPFDSTTYREGHEPK
jgi:hypothetical protein